MGTETALAPVKPGNGSTVAMSGPLSAQEIRAQVNLIQEVMREVMKDGEHYGKIPGCGEKPALLKGGAEKLCLTFRLDPQYEVTQTYEGDHLTILSKCILFHIPTGNRMGSGMGSCSTRESKYAYRKAERVCPACGKPAIIKGKAEFGGGWLCWAKKDGCNAKFKDDDQAIVGQQTGRVINEDKPDQYNTVLKMANKRSLVAAVLNVTAASDIFTQDIEDIPLVTPDVDPAEGASTPPPPKKEPEKPKPQKKQGQEPWTGKVLSCELVGKGLWKVTGAKGEQFFTSRPEAANVASSAASQKSDVEILHHKNSKGAEVADSIEPLLEGRSN